ncbi:MAG: SEFIR domain-containing protein [Blastocatellia bacterium]
MGLTSEDDPPKVFISYSHDSETHRNNVLSLASRLRASANSTEGCKNELITTEKRWSTSI